MKAIWNGKVIAESDDTIMIEGNHYFPVDSVNGEYLSGSELHTTCPWKGEASYYGVTVDGETSEGGAWYYTEPKPSLLDIVGEDYADYVAFWRGVEVIE